MSDIAVLIVELPALDNENRAGYPIGVPSEFTLVLSAPASTQLILVHDTLNSVGGRDDTFCCVNVEPSSLERNKSLSTFCEEL